MYGDKIESNETLAGLPRKCPECKIIAHYEVKGRKSKEVECPLCDFKFTVQKYKRGERPK
jgi:uncharacterized Zn finger protein (UPF0148 family)